MLDQEAVSKLRRFMELRQAKDVAEVAFEKAKKEYQEAETDVYESLSEGAISGTIKVDLGEPFGKVGFLPRTTVYGRIVDKNLAHDYFLDRQMTDEMYDDKIKAANLNGLVREIKETGESMPPGVDYYSRTGVTVTQQKK